MPVDGLQAAFLSALEKTPGFFLDDTIAIAVSGGGDSIALMHLAARTIEARLIDVITVDHGLRAEAAKEIAVVAEQARALGLRHTVLTWAWDGTGNLQARAREGRLKVMSQWARQNDCDALLMGHTEDDQVETFMMRLARGSGVDGLAGMNGATFRDDMYIVRPLLAVSRETIRDWLTDQSILWCDDPSNDDRRFDRVRARQMMDSLADLGLTRQRVLQSIDHMQAAKSSLELSARQFADAHVTQDRGDLVFDRDALDLASGDVPRRIIAAGLQWVGGVAYRPRFARLMDVVTQVTAGHAATLGGCVLLPQSDGSARITREAAATASWLRPDDYSPDAQGALWDKRWFLTGPLRPGHRVAALGDGITQCPKWRETGLPRPSLLSSPAIWRGDDLIAAPIAGLSNGWSAQIVADFHSSAFAH